MKKRDREQKRGWRGTASLCLLSVAALWAPGCTTANYGKSDAAALSMQRAAAEVQAESNAVELAQTALNELFQEAGADLRPAFRQYSTAVDRLEAAARKTQATGQRMGQRNRTYLTAWEKNLTAIEYEHVREISQARKDEVGKRFEAVRQRYDESQQAVEPLLTYLKDIRTALGTDLTGGGREALKGVADNAGRNAQKLQTALAALEDELKNSGARLSSVLPAGGTAAASAGSGAVR